MPVTVEDVLRATAFRRTDVEALLDPKQPSWIAYDTELGYVPNDIVMRDGIDSSLSTYSYEPAGQRRMINYSDRPCRINSYGDSFTQCQQVSDGETWQECLAAHFGEPIRNFGSGGYGAYQAYLRARRMEATDCAAEHLLFNIFHDDHIRNLDAARWIRSYWHKRNYVPEGILQLHGLPWCHLRFDVGKGRFVERQGLCPTERDLRALCDPDRFVEVFKDDAVARLFTLEVGGEADVADLEQLAGALGVAVALRDPARRKDDALKLHRVYGFKSTEYLLGKMRPWLAAQGKKLLILLSYGESSIETVLKGGQRPDQPFVDYLLKNRIPFVDALPKHVEDFKRCNVSVREYMDRHFVNARAAAVFGHYTPAGNHFFAFGIKNELVKWLDPKPPAYRGDGQAM